MRDKRRQRLIEMMRTHHKQECLSNEKCAIEWLTKNAVGEVYMHGTALYFEHKTDKALYILRWTK